MNQDQRQLFRQESLERLSSPERLDQMMQVITPQAWLPLLALALLSGCGILWSIFGRIPITVRGAGVLIQPRQLVPIQATTDGQLQALSVNPGDCVVPDRRRGPTPTKSVVAVIDPSDLRQQRQLQQRKLLELQQQDRVAATLDRQRLQLETAARQQERLSLQQRLQDARVLSPQLHRQNKIALQEQQASLQQQLQDAKALSPVFDERFQQRQQLFEAGALPKDTVLEADQARRQNQQQISDLQAQLKQLQVMVTEAEQRYLDAQNTAAQLQAQLQSLEAQATTLTQTMQQTANQRRNDILDVQRTIAQLSKQIQDHSTITSPQRGCIVELLVTPGQVVSAGTPIASLAVGDATYTPMGIAYFDVGDGKLIRPGMSIQVTPTSVKRERFGGIVGTVKSVSALPVSQQGAVTRLGNTELAEALLGQGPRIEVQAELKTDPATASGYQWSSSRGPQDVQITSGSTIQSWVMVEQRAPITFLLPILREWSGVQ